MSVPVVKISDTEPNTLTEEARDFLCGLGSKPIQLWTCAGAYRTGKSFLLSYVAHLVRGAKELFKIGDAGSCTIGADICSEPLEVSRIAHLVGATAHEGADAFLLDLEGKGGGDETHIVNLMLPAMMCSNVIMYNWAGMVGKDILDDLQLLARLGEKANAQDGSGSVFGHLHIVQRNWQYNQDAAGASASLLQQETLDGLVGDQKDLAVKRNAIRNLLLRSFRSVSIHQLPHPKDDTGDLGHVDFAAVSPRFHDAVILMLRQLLPHLCENNARVGARFAGLWEEALQMLESEDAFDRVSVLRWGDIQECKSAARRLGQAAMDSLAQVRRALPLEVAVLTSRCEVILDAAKTAFRSSVHADIAHDIRSEAEASELVGPLQPEIRLLAAENEGLLSEQCARLKDVICSSVASLVAQKATTFRALPTIEECREWALTEVDVRAPQGAPYRAAAVALIATALHDKLHFERSVVLQSELSDTPKPFSTYLFAWFRHDDDKMARCARQLVHMNPNARTFAGLALTMTEGHADFVNEALRLDATVFDRTAFGLIGHGRFLLEANDGLPDEHPAMQCILKAVRQYPDNLEVHLAHAEALSSQSRYADAIPVFEALLEKCNARIASVTDQELAVDTMASMNAVQARRVLYIATLQYDIVAEKHMPAQPKESVPQALERQRQALERLVLLFPTDPLANCTFVRFLEVSGYSNAAHEFARGLVDRPHVKNCAGLHWLLSCQYKQNGDSHMAERHRALAVKNAAHDERIVMLDECGAAVFNADEKQEMIEALQEHIRTSENVLARLADAQRLELLAGIPVDLPAVFGDKTSPFPAPALPNRGATNSKNRPSFGSFRGAQAATVPGNKPSSHGNSASASQRPSVVHWPTAPPPAMPSTAPPPSRTTDSAPADLPPTAPSSAASAPLDIPSPSTDPSVLPDPTPLDALGTPGTSPHSAPSAASAPEPMQRHTAASFTSAPDAKLQLMEFLLKSNGAEDHETASTSSSDESNGGPVLDEPKHFGIICDNCSTSDFPGMCYECQDCADFHLCGKCKDEEPKGHKRDHRAIVRASETHMEYINRQRASGITVVVLCVNANSLRSVTLLLSGRLGSKAAAAVKGIEAGKLDLDAGDDKFLSVLRGCSQIQFASAEWFVNCCNCGTRGELLQRALRLVPIAKGLLLSKMYLALIRLCEGSVADGDAICTAFGSLTLDQREQVNGHQADLFARIAKKAILPLGVFDRVADVFLSDRRPGHRKEPGAGARSGMPFVVAAMENFPLDEDIQSLGTFLIGQYPSHLPWLCECGADQVMISAAGRFGHLPDIKSQLGLAVKFLQTKDDAATATGFRHSLLPGMEGPVLQQARAWMTSLKTCHLQSPSTLLAHLQAPRDRILDAAIAFLDCRNELPQKKACQILALLHDAEGYSHAGLDETASRPWQAVVVEYMERIAVAEPAESWTFLKALLCMFNGGVVSKSVLSNLSHLYVFHPSFDITPQAFDNVASQMEALPGCEELRVATSLTILALAGLGNGARLEQLRAAGAVKLLENIANCTTDPVTMAVSKKAVDAVSRCPADLGLLFGSWAPALTTGGTMHYMPVTRGSESTWILCLCDDGEWVITEGAFARKVASALKPVGDIDELTSTRLQTALQDMTEYQHIEPPFELAQVRRVPCAALGLIRAAAFFVHRQENPRLIHSSTCGYPVVDNVRFAEGDYDMLSIWELLFVNVDGSHLLTHGIHAAQALDMPELKELSDCVWFVKRFKREPFTPRFDENEGLEPVTFDELVAAFALHGPTVNEIPFCQHPPLFRELSLRYISKRGATLLLRGMVTSDESRGYRFCMPSAQTEATQEGVRESTDERLANVQSLFAEAQTALGQDDHDNALRALRDAVIQLRVFRETAPSRIAEVTPLFLDVYCLQADASIVVERWREAESACQSALELSPADARAQSLLLRAREGLANQQQATHGSQRGKREPMRDAAMARLFRHLTGSTAARQSPNGAPPAPAAAPAGDMRGVYELPSDGGSSDSASNDGEASERPLPQAQPQGCATS